MTRSEALQLMTEAKGKEVGMLLLVSNSASAAAFFSRARVGRADLSGLIFRRVDFPEGNFAILNSAPEPESDEQSSGFLPLDIKGLKDL